MKIKEYIKDYKMIKELNKHSKGKGKFQMLYLKEDIMDFKYEIIEMSDKAIDPCFYAILAI